MIRFPRPSFLFRPEVRGPRLRASSFALMAGGVLAVVAAQALPAIGQVPVPVSVSITPEVPAGFTTQNLPTQTNQRVIVTVVNSGTAAVLNQQIVVRLGARPDAIVSVSDGIANVGVMDATTGAWYHTIPSIAAGATATYALTWLKICPGRWPLAVRVADKSASISAQWVGPADARCGPDEVTSPQSASFYQLAWPPTALGATTTTSLLPGATLAPGATLVPGATTTAVITVPGLTTVPVATTVAGATTTTIAGAVTTRPGGVTQPSLIQLTLSTAASTTTKPASTTTIAKSTTTKPGTVILCKTVGGKRYCAPKSSAYKEGQKKSVEVKPKVTKKK